MKTFVASIVSVSFALIGCIIYYSNEISNINRDLEAFKSSNIANEKAANKAEQDKQTIQNELDIKKTELDVMKTELGVMTTELDLKKTELDDSKVQVHLANQRIKDSNLQLGSSKEQIDSTDRNFDFQTILRT